MPYSSRTRRSGYSYSGFFPVGVKWLLITNVSLFVLYYFSVQFGFAGLFHHFGLIPAEVVYHFSIWQLVTYMFLHDPTGFGHIIFNMLTLWMFGKDLEQTWGTRRFLKYYFLCGIGAGVCAVVGNLIFGNAETRTIGASGAIYGLLLAFGMLFPDVQILWSFILPIKAKYFVAILGAIEFMLSFASSGSNVSHVAHLGGMLFGYVYLKSRRSRSGLLVSWQDWYKNYKLQRAKRKFQVYLKKRGSGDRDRWVN